MKNAISISLLALLALPVSSQGQDAQNPLPDAPLPSTARASDSPSSLGTVGGVPGVQPNTAEFGLNKKFHYYLTETYLNPGAVTAPAVRAGIRMANLPGRGTTRYPVEWRQGAEAFARNYGDALAERTSFQTARFVSGVLTHEDPRYKPSGGHNVLARSIYALSFSFVDRSDSGRPMPALSNFVGAAAGGFVANTYLPTGFNNVTHAGQRATIRFGTFAAGNLFREFAPQMPGPMRTFFTLVAR
jgi:hypothetical protein